MTHRTRLLAACLTLLLSSSAAEAFCGFYVGRAGAKLFNHSSQVVLVRDGQRTVITMANDFQGPLTEFAAVIPVPTFLHREQIHVGESALIDHLDAYTAPRLVEYFDPNPCSPRYLERDALRQLGYLSAPKKELRKTNAAALGVRIEASYTVGEYDILILSAEESRGLVRWLKESGYRVPRGAEPIVASYLKQGMRFFVAKVNLGAQKDLGYQNLRPLQVAFESPMFMLPIRLGTVNADGPQELFLYTLTRQGRVETANYSTIELPSGETIPTFVKEDFGRFYRSMFDHQVERQEMRSVFVEYAWDMAWCDPCAAAPLSADELRQLGVFWLNDGERGQAQDVFVTRLHLRYDANHFPEDLKLRHTNNRENFQSRYVLQHPWSGGERCSAAREYLEFELPRRQEKEALTLADLTGWNVGEIRRRYGLRTASGGRNGESDPWWKKIWR